MRAAVEALEECCARFPSFGEWTHSRIDAALSLLRAELEAGGEAVGWSGEDAAMQQITEARMRLAAAIEAYEATGYGSHVTQPVRDALALVEFSIKEVTS